MGQGKSRRKKIACKLRLCRTHRELEAFVRLQKRVFGLTDHETYPERSLVVMNKIGGAVLGAFDPKDRMVGFLNWLPAWDREGRYFYSLALGVLARHRDQGLGRAIKLEQRRLALKAGVERIQWTFDLFGSKMPSSTLKGWEPLPANTFLITTESFPRTRRRALRPTVWRRCGTCVRGGWSRRPWLEGEGAREGQGARARLRSRCRWTSGRMANEHPRRARGVQQRVRREFLRHLSRGLVVTGIQLGTDSATYVLEGHQP